MSNDVIRFILCRVIWDLNLVLKKGFGFFFYSFFLDVLVHRIDQCYSVQTEDRFEFMPHDPTSSARLDVEFRFVKGT